MATYEVRRFPTAAWDNDSEQWNLGAPGDLILSVDAAYPAAAQTLVLGQLRLDVRGMTFLGTLDAVAAWETRDGVVAIVAQQ